MAVKARYHPYLFLMMTLSGMAELGLTAFLISSGNESGTWPSSRYHSLLILFIFNAVWTTIFSTAYMLWIVDGAVHLLASVSSSVIYLCFTAIIWGVATGVMHNTRTGGSCNNSPPISRCRQSLTVESLGWVEFGLCLITLLSTCLWVFTSKQKLRNSYYV